jgi:hypothetical protein
MPVLICESEIMRETQRRSSGRIMGVQDKSRRWGIGAVLLGATGMAAACLTIALLSPAQAQFWSPFGAPRRPPAPIQQQPQPQYQQQQQYNPFGGFLGPQEIPRPSAPADNSHAPSPQARKSDVAPTTSVVVMGDAMADWLAYGLEDAFSERPEIGVVRKNRTGSGLIRYDPKRDVDWAQTAREIIAAEKPKFIVMMVGTNDHQPIRERAPAPAPRAAPAAGKPGAAPAGSPGQTAETAPAPTEDVPDAENPDQTPLIAAEKNTSATGPFEFHTDQWEAAYIKRIDATIAALKSAGVPVFWVGLPAERGPKATADSSYLNELYRGRAEKAGIVFVDVWDGFVDEQGRYSPQGPDFEGQIRRLRSADGIYFTKAGARKLAHYVEREIDRTEANRAIPVALPSSLETAPAGAKAGGPSARPLVGPVVPLTVSTTGAAAEELLGGARPAAPPAHADPLATRVLIKGEAIAAPTGRADDFNWPRGGAATVTAEPISPSPPASASASAGPAAASGAAQSKTAKPPAPAPGTATAYQRLEVDGAPDETKPKVAKKPAPALAPAPARPAPFANIPNIFR